MLSYSSFILALYCPQFVFLFVKVVQLKVFISLIKIIFIMWFFSYYTELHFKFFSDLLTIDFPIFLLRFLSVYNIISFFYNLRLFFKVFLGLNSSINSVTKNYVCASWFERECWDFFGIFYINNLDLRRILNDYGFFGHPFKKNYPLNGFLEVYIYFFVSLIFYAYIKIGQGFRSFSLISPWNRRGIL